MADNDNDNDNRRDRRRGATGGFSHVTPADDPGPQQRPVRLRPSGAEPPATGPRSATPTGQRGRPPAAAPEPATEPGPPPGDADPAQPVWLAARFGSASAALVFAGSVASTGNAQSLRYSRGESAAPAGAGAGTAEPAEPAEPGATGASDAAGGWWVGAELPLDLGRELAAAAHGRMFVRVDGLLLADRGWGGPPAPKPPARAGLRGRRGTRSAPADLDRLDPAQLRPVGIVDVVRAAGLHPAYRASAPAEVVVLLPGMLATAVVRRALDLGLTVRYRPVRVSPLFDGGPPTVSGSGGHGSAGRAAASDRGIGGPAASGHRAGGHGAGGPFGTGHVATELRLAAPGGELPLSLLDALEQDPFVLVCRAGGDRLLVQLQAGCALPDTVLADLVDHGTWVLADPAFGCWRLTGLAEPADATTLVRLGAGYRLDPAPSRKPGFAVPDAASAEDAVPAPRAVAIVVGRTPGVDTDATLLDDHDLASLPALLETHPLSDVAQLVRGRDRHLLFAAGGLLERLPVGEPLYCLGPGPLYLPVGYRMNPRLPATARQALFGVDAATAVVALAEAALAFDLTSRVPVWALWAGQAPALDLQLPHTTMEVLADVEKQTTPVPRPPKVAPTPAPRGRTRELLDRLRNRSPAEAAPRTWRDDALDLELAGDLPRAAELHESHGDLLRAAHLFERAAHLDGRGDDRDNR